MEPAEFTLQPGESRRLTITVTREDATLSAYTTGALALASARHTVRLSVAVRPVVVAAPAEVTAPAAVGGSVSWSVTPGVTGALGTTVLGLHGAAPQAGEVATGPFTGAPSPATRAFAVAVPADRRLVRLDLDTADDRDDLDLFLADERGRLVAVSASGAADERLTVTLPPGRYVAYVNGFAAGAGGAFTYTQWALGGSPDAVLSVDPLGASRLAEPQPVTARWSGLQRGQRYLGRVGYTAEGTTADTATYLTVG